MNTPGEYTDADRERERQIAEEFAAIRREYETRARLSTAERVYLIGAAALAVLILVGAALLDLDVLGRVVMILIGSSLLSFAALIAVMLADKPRRRP